MGPNVQVFPMVGYTKFSRFHLPLSATVTPHGSYRPENMLSQRKGIVRNTIPPRTRPKTQDNLVEQLIFLSYLVEKIRPEKTAMNERFHQTGALRP